MIIADPLMYLACLSMRMAGRSSEELVGCWRSKNDNKFKGIKFTSEAVSGQLMLHIYPKYDISDLTTISDWTSIGRISRVGGK